MPLHQPYRFFLLIVVVLCYSKAAEAQSADSTRHFLALDVTQQDIDWNTEANLDRIRNAGIHLLLIDPDTELPATLSPDFSLILFSDNSYRTVGQVRESAARTAQTLVSEAERIEGRYPRSLAAIELYRYPNDRNPAFHEAAAPVTDSIRVYTDLPIFYTSATDSDSTARGPFSYIASVARAETDPDYEFSSFVHFNPSDDLNVSLSSLNQLLDTQLVTQNSVIVLPAGWFFSASESVPGMATVLNRYTSGERIPMPLPADSGEGPVANWSVVFLLLLWISFLLHYRYQPVYGQSLSRYFLHHPFYVIDVMEHRVRNSTPGLIVLLQHAAITALFTYLSADILISETGLHALQVQVPELFLFQNPLLSLSLAGFSFALITQGISVLWIYFLNKELTSFSQALNLYSWPLHVNLLLTTVLVVLSQTGITGFWIAAFAILFGLTWFMSFIIASVDAAKFLKNRLLYLLLTTGIHVLAVMILSWFLFTSPMIFEPLQMAFTFGK
ncbi:hypothetical protein [Rhodohalobacter mucosus]|uniref:Uncharacterized protein n=1 Tax=Rhodohalobacter mucosus TaxID=2079485 RepID=A0A316TNV5_9BACT|nr:hypothetical protein [Rhodohalobacter mucosus]PWN06080.1 hypothetical protein DDZ15_09490 [Rhodohalobacter mucosus]